MLRSMRIYDWTNNDEFTFNALVLRSVLQSRLMIDLLHRYTSCYISLYHLYTPEA